MSRRPPHVSLDARFVAIDLTDDAGCAEVLAREAKGTTHLVYAALYEKPELLAGWLDEEQIATNTRMFRNVLDAVDGGLAGPATRDHDGGREVLWRSRPADADSRARGPRRGARPTDVLLAAAGLFTSQAGAAGVALDDLPARQHLRGIVREPDEPDPRARRLRRGAQGRGQAAPLFRGGESSIAQATDAELLARAIAWAGEAAAARDQIFNVTNGDVFVWENVWPAIARALGMEPGGRAPMHLATEMPARSALWDRVRSEHDLRAPDLEHFVGLSFQYMDSLLGIDDPTRVNPAIMSTIKLAQAGFHEVMDTENSLTKWFRRFQAERFLPPASWDA